MVNVGILTQLMLRPAFRDLVLSTVSTYGVYIISSLLFWDPWHMITSLVQYLLMIPSSVNILNVYAFCNIHDVSWGTKGDNQIQSAPATVVVQEKNGIQTATVDLPTNQSDIDTNYNLFADAIIVTQAEKEAEKRKRKQPQSQEDYFRAFRTRVVLFWILSNAILIGLLTTPESAVLVGVNLDDPLAFNPFLTFILWSVAALSTIRFIGSVLYIPFQSR